MLIISTIIITFYIGPVVSLTSYSLVAVCMESNLIRVGLISQGHLHRSVIFGADKLILLNFSLIGRRLMSCKWPFVAWSNSFHFFQGSKSFHIYIFLPSQK